MSDDKSFTEDVGGVRFTNSYVGDPMPSQEDLHPSLRPRDIQVTITIDGERDEQLEGQVLRELHARWRNDWRNHGLAEIVGEVAESLENDDWPVPVPAHGPDYLKVDQ